MSYLDIRKEVANLLLVFKGVYIYRLKTTFNLEKRYLEGKKQYGKYD